MKKTSRIKGSVLIAAGLLTTFGIIGTSLVAYTHQRTAERIAQNERDALLRKIGEILPSGAADNEVLNDSLTVQAPERLGAQQTTVYRAWLADQPSAVVFSAVEAEGYAGPIRLIIGVNRDGSLGGVRVLSHRETPGLGDRIEVSRSDWIHHFTGRSLTDPVVTGWKVRRDGGAFDHFTGATVTPRAIVRAVKSTLVYTGDNWHKLFDENGND